MSQISYADLVAAWDRQQEGYIKHREARFNMMIQTLAYIFDNNQAYDKNGKNATIIDVACGTGSLSLRLLQAFPDLTVYGMDYDPILGFIASQNLADYAERFKFIDADITADGWQQNFTNIHITAMLSSTALHYLSPQELLTFYTYMHKLLPVGSIFMNADHLRFRNDKLPFLAKYANDDDQQTQATHFASGAPTWDEWWASLNQIPNFQALQAERDKRFANKEYAGYISNVELHTSALSSIGFAEAGTLWQYLDNFIVYGIR